MSVLKNWKIYRRRGKHRTFAFTMACARRVIEADNLIWLNKYNSWLQELFFGNTLWRHALGIIEAETVMKKDAILINTKEFIQLSVTVIPHIESATRWIRESMTKTDAQKNIFGRQKFKLMNSPVLLSSAPRILFVASNRKRTPFIRQLKNGFWKMQSHYKSINISKIIWKQENCQEAFGL